MVGNMRRACTLCLVVTYLSGNNLDRNMLKNLCIYYTGRAPFPVIHIIGRWYCASRPHITREPVTGKPGAHILA
ncbi:hypothetical protein PR003_g13947 [Phytophthora rubi]|uniref:Uncharacterized protein n=1 Tax=Phytophthora rubi TaxID=129364 RepID=A0A6A3LSZ8_9STRA|nr:hypothetical protein PR001_g13150 [Phytophthora rubi]KAE9333589.1 hypothetical protein PR003_g13947 [Phytophthora rubi]